MNRHIRTIIEHAMATDPSPPVRKAIEAVLRKPPRSPARQFKPATGTKAKRDAEDKAFRAKVRAACVDRAAGRCEGCDAYVDSDRLHMDHFWGRAREESIESCWMLCPKCDREKTDNEPSHRAWLRYFQAWAVYRGYRAQARKCDAALAMEAAQHPKAHRASKEGSRD